MFNSFKKDDTVPGGVYLCQINERISCGACCGLYNLADTSDEVLRRILCRRTEAFEDISRNVKAILDYKMATDERESRTLIFPDFYHCPYLGMIGRGHSRVGCLLHPQIPGNNGVDFRGLSFFGGMACRLYLCPSYSRLSAAVKWIVGSAAGSWYRYGLIITESVLLNSFFLEVQRYLDQPLYPGAVLKNSRCFETFQKFVSLKLSWPFRPHTDPGPVHYFFKDQHYGKPAIDYTSIGAVGSRYDTILRELVSSFESRNELQQAESIVEALVREVVSHL